MPLLKIESLEVCYPHAGRPIEAVRGVSLTVEKGECVGLVGESGAGKTQLGLASLGLLSGARVLGSVQFEGRELLGADASALESVRGSKLTMIFQDPSSALTPHLKIGVQLGEVLVTHRGYARRAARAAALQALEQVQVPEPERRLLQYPHELSGGLRQRVLIAMALIGSPLLLVADEPTSALDVTVQAQILTLIETLRARQPLAIVLISHDLAVVARLAERILVMYAGRIIEHAPVERLLGRPRHPYSELLVQCAPRLAQPIRGPLPCVPGRAPRSDESPAGCAFAPRCPRVQERCRAERPELALDGKGGAVACHFPLAS
jgi:oligopeptide/dipeptide ABC transporter ATP-binding protein